PAEFEIFAETLHDAHLDPEAVTLIPGNHDAYTSADGWKLALEGPLRAFARGAASAPGKVVERGSAIFLPLDTSRHQSVLRSGGSLPVHTASALAVRLDDPSFEGKAI